MWLCGAEHSLAGEARGRKECQAPPHSWKSHSGRCFPSEESHEHELTLAIPGAKSVKQEAELLQR